MTHEQFCYWLQGFCELSPNTPPSLEQWIMIQEHLGLTFKKVTSPLQPVETTPMTPAKQDFPTYPTYPQYPDEKSPQWGPYKVTCQTTVC